jgi:Tfp pilus assembly protein PilP
MKERNQFTVSAIFVSIVMLAVLVTMEMLSWAAVTPVQPSKGKPSVLGLPQPIMPVSPEPAFVYSIGSKIDPFKPFIRLEPLPKAALSKKELPASISALQLYPIEQYKLIGIAGSTKGYTAIIKDILGKFYPLTVGTIIGVEKGRVIQIQINKILVEERISQGKQMKSRIKYMTFQSEEEGKP